jgi:predicted CoA-binding protein
MVSVKQAAPRLLAHKRIVVTGVSHTPQGHGSNIVYRRLPDHGCQVFAVNPNADQAEGDRCHHDLAFVPRTAPETAAATTRECADLGIKYVWIHRFFGAAGASPAATHYGRRHGVTVIGRRLPADVRPHRPRRSHGDAPGLPCTGKVPSKV